jgi:hypothetical protein
MNIPLEQFYNNISYKLWLIQFNIIEDIINLIKDIYFYVAIRRSLNPPPIKYYPEMNELTDYKYDYINDEGIYYHFSLFLNSTPDIIITGVYSIFEDVFCITYEHLHFLIMVDFLKSNINRVEIVHLNIDPNHNPIITNHYKKYKTPVEIVSIL